MLNDVVDSFNKSQEFTTVQLDAGSRTMEVRQKLLVAYAAGAAPDIAGVVQTNVQEYFDTGVMSPVEPYFSKWDQKDDYFPNVVEFMHSKPGQPVLYMPARILPYVLFYRADWFDEAKLAPPKTYDEFIEAARRLTKPGEHAGVAIRGVDYYAVQPIDRQAQPVDFGTLPAALLRRLDGVVGRRGETPVRRLRILQRAAVLAGGHARPFRRNLAGILRLHASDVRRPALDHADHLVAADRSNLLYITWSKWYV